jgi:hypothetical protein
MSGNKFLWIIVAMLALGVGGFFGIRSVVRSNTIKPFNDHLAEYMVEAKAPADAGGAPRSCGAKMITVDMTEREIDYFYFDLPDEYRASTPEEVQTVVQMKWTKYKCGEYEGGKPAYQQLCDVALVDKASGELIASQQCVGSDPPRSIDSRSSSGTGDKPTAQILGFLKNRAR